MKLADHHREVSNELSRYGVKPEVEPTRGGHVRFRWKVNDRPQCMTVAKTPSDHRGVKNNLAKVRRMMRDAGVKTISETPPAAESGTSSSTATIASLLARIVQLEADMQLLLDQLTVPGVPTPVAQVAPVAPVAEVVPTHPCHVDLPKPKKKGRHLKDYSWLWRVLRYDVFLPFALVAKETAKACPRRKLAVTLFRLRARGLIEHRRKEGWRKAIAVEHLAPPAKTNGVGAHH